MNKRHTVAPDAWADIRFAQHAPPLIVYDDDVSAADRHVTHDSPLACTWHGTHTLAPAAQLCQSMTSPASDDSGLGAGVCLLCADSLYVSRFSGCIACKYVLPF